MLANSGFEFPAGRITVNLVPADLPKDGGRFDLAVAVGILVASGHLNAPALERNEVYGELGLSGELRPAPGLVLAAAHAAAADRVIVVPQANAAELRAAPLPAIDPRIFPADDLRAVGAHLGGLQPLADLSASAAGSCVGPRQATTLDLADIIEKAPAKRALVIAAAGGHSLLMIGPPGCGKSMLAQRLPGILPPLSAQQHVEVAGIRSVCGTASGATASDQRPFRAPHHTASASAIIGGGPQARTGEIMLAHRGVREALREPLESGVIAVTRAGRQCEYPARFQLVAAMNPCPCGYLGEPCGRCRCSPNSLQRYQARISGPLLDRIDLRVQLTRVAESEWQAAAGPSGPNTVQAAAQVAAARRIQLERSGILNAALGSAQLAKNPGISIAARQLLLAASAAIAPGHMAEALQLRRPN